MIRDFTDESKQKMLNLVVEVEQEKLYDFTDWVGDRWLDFQDWIGVLDIRHYVDDVNKYHKKVIDKNNTAADAIETIFDNVRNVDSSYAGKLRERKSLLEQWQRYIIGMTDIVSPVNRNFSSEYMKSTLGAVQSDLVLSTNVMEEEFINNASPKDLIEQAAELAERILKIEDKETVDGNEIKDISGLVSRMSSYIRKLIELADGDAENWKIFISEAFKAVDGGVSLWEEIAKLIQYLNEIKEIPIVEKIGIGGDIASLLASILEVIGKDYNSVGEFLSNVLNKIGGSVVDLTGAIYKLCAKVANGVVTIYTGIVKAIFASYGQFIKSLEEYAKDGKYDIGDISDTGIDVAVAGLAELISSVTLGIISEKTTGISAEEVSEELKNSVKELGTKAAKYILDDRKLREMYANGNAAEKALLMTYAIAMVQYEGTGVWKPYGEWQGEHLEDPDDIAMLIAQEKSKNVVIDYSWAD